MLGLRDRISRQTSMPEPSGSLASSTATWGCRVGICACAWATDPDSPMTWMSPSLSSRSFSPSRTIS